MLAIIPARGGSKGLPGKNIIDFCGKPLIAHTIEAALASREITRVVVSTDCEDIATVARQYNADVPFMRPDNLSGDTARAIDVYTHVIDELGGAVEVSEFTVLLPTCPLRERVDIDSAIDIFNDSNAASVISYTEEHHPIKWHQYINSDASFDPIFEETLNNRQDERVSYYPNGAIYVFKSSLIQGGNYYDESSRAYIMPRNRSVDIDTLDDLMYAKFLRGGCE